MTPWNLKQLKDAMLNDLGMCRTDFERLMARTIGGKEIRETAERIAATRRLTPGEAAIASEFGWRA